MNNNDLKELIAQDQIHIINFLLAHNLKVKNNQVTLLFSDGDVDETKLDQLSFVNLWELQYEPSLVRAEFIVEGEFKIDRKLRKTLRQLNINITTRSWPVNPQTPLDYSKTIGDEYNQFQSITIAQKKDELKINLIGAIGYFS